MKNQKIIHLGSRALKIFKWFYLFSFVAFTIIIVLWFTNKDLFENAMVSTGFKAGVGSTDIAFKQINTHNNGISIYNLSSLMVVWLFIRTGIFFLLGYMIIKQVEKIMKSLESLSVFYRSNIESFQKIAKICIYIAILGCFNIFWVGEKFELNFTIPFFPLLASLSCFLLAIIFEEGLKLSEENKTII